MERGRERRREGEAEGKQFKDEKVCHICNGLAQAAGHHGIISTSTHLLTIDHNSI